MCLEMSWTILESAENIIWVTYKTVGNPSLERGNTYIGWWQIFHDLYHYYYYHSYYSLFFELHLVVLMVYLWLCTQIIFIGVWETLWGTEDTSQVCCMQTYIHCTIYIHCTPIHCTISPVNYYDVIFTFCFGLH